MSGAQANPLMPETASSPTGPGPSPEADPGAGPNPMAPAPSPLAGSAPGPVAHPDISSWLETLQAQFAKSGKALRLVGGFESQLEKLQKLGDTVSPDDVVEAAGKMVDQGADPLALAGLLADMPDGGGAIAGWLAQHTAALAAQKSQLAAVHEALRHQLGVTSLHALTSVTMHPASASRGLQPSSAGAALTPTAGSSLAGMAPAGNA